MKRIIILLFLPVTMFAQTKIEGEAYTSMKGVQLENTTDIGGGKNIGYIDPTDFMEYAYTAASSGTYTVSIRVAANSAAKFTINGDTVSVASTGGYQNWATVTKQLFLSAGKTTIKIVSISGSWNLNWIQVAYLTPVYVEVPDSTFTFDFIRRTGVILYKDGTSEAITLPKSPVRIKQ